MINDYEVRGSGIVHAKTVEIDVDVERANQIEFDKLNKVSTSKPKKTKNPKGPKSPRVKADYNIGSKGCLMPEVHNLRDIQNPYSSPKQPPANSAIVQRLQAAQPKTRLRRKL